ncbi:MAG TPA: ester cyclase [Verrucomicrobiae bacterium]
MYPSLHSFIRTYTDKVWNERNPEAMRDYYSPAYIHHDVSRPDVITLADYQQWARDLVTAFPDLQVQVDDVLAEEGRAVKRWTASGTHQGVLAGIQSTGKKVRFSGVSCYRVVEWRIAESWYVYDLFGLLKQVGAIP